MAEINYNVLVKHPGWLVVEWLGMADEDVGVPLEKPEFSYKVVTVMGTDGTGGAVGIEGAVIPEGEDADWCPLNDIHGDPVAVAAGEAVEVGEHPLYIRPIVTGDMSTVYDVRMTLSGSWRR